MYEMYGMNNKKIRKYWLSTVCKDVITFCIKCVRW